MGDRDRAEVEAELHELSRRELIRAARRSSMEGQSEYAFAHTLVKDVCYAQIPRAYRAERHTRAAAWIEQMDRVEDHAEILASHYSAALELARAARDPDTTELEAGAIRYLTLAGDRALGMDVDRAFQHYARALELTPEGHAQRPALLNRWADAARQANRLAEAVKALEEAVETFQERREVLSAARAMTTLANLLWYLADARSKHVAAEAIALLEAAPVTPELVAAYSEMARLEELSGDHVRAIGLADRALALARDLAMEEPAKALAYRGLARCGLGEPSALEDLRRALALAIEQGQGWEATVIYNNLAVTLLGIEGPAAELAVLREGIDFAERRGISEAALGLAGSSLKALIDMGSWDEVLETAAALTEALEPGGSLMTLSAVRCNEATVLASTGRADEALPLATWAARTAREAKAIDHLACNLPIEALARLGTGDSAGAVDVLTELSQVAHVKEDLFYMANLPGMVRTAIAAGDVALGERLARGQVSIYAYAEHAMFGTSAILAEARGDPEEAVRLYAQAAGRWETFRVVPERAFALLGHGRCLLALGRPSEATGPLRDAREIFASLGAKPALAETDVLLERATPLTS